MLKKLKLPWTGASLTAKIYQSLSRREIENVTKSHFATNKLNKKIAKETMATGVYATNMEIEMLKKELSLEQARLSKAAAGERISPPKVTFIS